MCLEDENKNNNNRPTPSRCDSNFIEYTRIITSIRCRSVLHVRKERITTDIFELLSGIFAVILCVLSLRAYIKLKIKGMLFVSAAFGIFAARTIAIETRDLYLGGGDSSALESILSVMFLMAIVLFFLAIAQKERIKLKRPQPDI